VKESGLSSLRVSGLGPAGLVVGLAFLWAGCATQAPIPTYGDLPSAEKLYEEGVAELEYQRSRRLMPADYLVAIEIFQDIIDNYPYSEQAVLAELAIADAYFENGGFDEAISYYLDFADLHPEHGRVPYAIYRRALSHYGQSKKAGRDQSETIRAIETLEQLVVRYPHSAHTVDGEKLLIRLRTRIARHDMGIGDFYFKKGEYPSAADRYRDLLNRFPGLGLDAEALYKLGLCYTRMNREGEAHEIFQVILDNYQGSEVADAAADLIPAAN
jgi:outer membrane protein assembly factor BamD